MNVKVINAHWQLLYQMAKREIKSRYRGSMFGIAWTFLNPLIMLAVYNFVFSVVFKAKWGGGENTNFAVMMFSGMIIHALFCEVILLSTNSIVGNANYVKKVIFPLEILTLVITLSALFNFLISFFVLVSMVLLFGGHITLSILWLPIVIMPLIMLSIGIGWVVSALGVFIRDISQFMGVITSLLLFLSPVFFSITSIPESFRKFIEYNPLTLIIGEFRKILITGGSPDLVSLFKYFLCSLVFALLAFIIFRKLRKGFADVL
ncbi:ABC transporter permease [Aeromonas salmonicida]|uniref:ABC transporter permease n=1 Tax=Aeromonas salmonicida TaxID=645 RepID=UPI000DE57FC6|nr:ABC transporter permease [Aeromonas salmonicida]